MNKSPFVVITCEHGGNEVPTEWRHLFRGAAAVLKSHRGWDPGTLSLADSIAAEFGAPLHAATTTRLLIELNRSLGHAALFSEFTRSLPADEKKSLVSEHWRPHRDSILATIRAAVTQGHQVIHLAIHSFTPVWNEQPRRTDVGLLFDPRRRSETSICRRWQQRLQSALPDHLIHRNQPYRGTSDGLTTALRREFPDELYAGVEVEVNQRLIARHGPAGDRIRAELILQFQEVVFSPPTDSGPGVR